LFSIALKVSLEESPQMRKMNTPNKPLKAVTLKILKRILAVISSLTILYTTQSSVAQYSQNGLRGASESIYAAATDASGNLYVGGDITGLSVGGATALYNSIFVPRFGSDMGDASASGIAVWNPNTPGWSALLDIPTPPGQWDGTQGVGGRVKTIAVDLNPNGLVYVGGQFGSVTDGNIAAWDPIHTQWIRLIGSVDNFNGSRPDTTTIVNAMTIANGNVYVVGSFQRVYASTGPIVLATNIASWSILNTKWSNVGAAPPVGLPLSIATPDGGTTLYVGGQSGIARGVLAQGAYTWQIMDNTLVGAVNAITFTPGGRLFIGGSFPFGNSAYYLEEWNSALNKFQNVQNGPFLYDGSFNSINSLAVYKDNLIVGGQFSGFPDNPGNPSYHMLNIARYNFTSNVWFTLGPTTPNNQLGGAGLGGTSPGQEIPGVLALAVSLASANNTNDTVYAGGGFGLFTPNERVDNVAAWNAVANIWQPLNNAPPTITITSPTSGRAFLPSPTITITASFFDDNIINSVNFFAGNTQIGSATAAPYTFNWANGSTTPASYSLSWPNVAPGLYSLTAAATDNDGAAKASSAVSVLVDAMPTVTLTSPANNANFLPGAVIPLIATANSLYSTITSVKFYDNNNTLLQTITVAPYTFNWNNAAAGTHVLTAVATDAIGAVTTSSAVSVLVDAVPTVTLTSPANNASFLPGAIIPLSATASSLYSTITSVKFYDNNNTLLQTITVAPYTFNWNNAAVGTHVLTAVATDAIGAVTTSGAITVTVNSPSCTPPPSGLVSWWRAEGNTLDQMNVNNGLPVGPVSYISGEVGQTFSFNGTSSYVSISNSPSLNPTGAFSIEGWIYPTQDGNQKILSKWGDEGVYNNNRSYNLVTVSGLGLAFSISDLANQANNAFQTFAVTGVLTLNAWNYVAATYDSTTGIRCLYVNGVIVGSHTNAPVAVYNSVTPVTIGSWLRQPGTVQDYFKGSIDELSMYSRALSSSEILGIFNAGSAGKCH
jgi:Concanavalin A-like lectin/glucanases superfamily/Bacterial Ig domain